MITTSGVTLRYGKRTLFEDVTLKFVPGNCYGLIGANGAGKSTFLKILSGEIEAQQGKVEISKGARMSVLKQNHFEFDEKIVLETVIMGNKRLYEIMKEKDAIYSKAEFTEEDGIRASELEAEFGEMNGWEAESEAATILNNLGIHVELHQKLLKELNENEKVRVLLAQALFGNPDILLMDEPTNGLDLETVSWLEDFLAEFKNVAIVVSHDRHFLDSVCTHIADIDFGKIQLYTGNYSFWYQASQLAIKQRQEQNKKAEEKKKELEEFIARFSANVAKSRQATARKKMIDKLNIEEIKPSNRKYPYIAFKPERELGDQVLETENLSAAYAEGYYFKEVTLKLTRKDKVAVLSKDSLAITAFFNILAEEQKPSSGTFKWGITTNVGYFPQDNSKYFSNPELNLVDWLRQYSAEKDETFIRSFLGRMLFSGEEGLKKSTVLSGGEKVRCMLSKLMLQSPNIVLLDDPTNHLDMESIIALNNGLKDFEGVLLLSSHDHELLQTVCNRVIELTPNGIIDKLMTLDEYLESDAVREQRNAMYGTMTNA
jgi:ATPase subunit of ABC transporter with duplicated ATPase domains